MWICISLLCLGAIALTLFLIEKTRRYSVRATLIKSIASLLFITLSVYTYFHSGNTFGIFVIVAQVFGLLGDIWLDFKYVFKEQEKTFTYAGFIVFGIGHMLYVGGMTSTFMGDGWWWNLLIAIGVGLLAGVAVLLMEKPLKMTYGNYKWIVFLYSVLLFMTVGMSFLVALSQMFQNAGFNLLFAGAISFAISDLILCGTYFAEGKERPFDIISNGITYYLAQYLIAFSLFFL